MHGRDPTRTDDAHARHARIVADPGPILPVPATIANMWEHLLPVLIGVLAGLMSGLFGIGGGIVIVPLLVWLLHFEQHRAQGTSLAVFLVPVGILGVMNYYRTSNVDIAKAALVAVGLIGGAYLGSKVALGLSPLVMRRVFAFFLVAVAAHIFFKK